MAFTQSSAESRLLLTEDVTLANAAAAYSSAFTIPEIGADFTIFLNTAAANVVGATDTAEVQVSFDGTTFADITSGAFTAYDSAMEVYHYDASATGDSPYYRIHFPSSGGNDSSTVINVVVVTK